MSSGDKKNLLKTDNGFLRFGSNFEELLPGYESPLAYGDMDLRIINNAVARRREMNEIDQEAAAHDPHASHDHDHVLSFFERTLNRIMPQIIKAHDKKSKKDESEAMESMERSLSVSDEVISQEMADIEAETFRRKIESKQLLILSNYFTDAEIASYAKMIEIDELVKRAEEKEAKEREEAQSQEAPTRES